ncbi:MAG: hypothetical protein ABW252_10035 [Polyangiales bacterium]
MNARPHCDATRRAHSLLAVMTAALGLSCAATDSEPDVDLGTPSPVSSGTDATGAGPEDDDAIPVGGSFEKAAKFCCAHKRNGTVDKCYDMSGVKAWKGTQCNAKGPANSVLRDGECSQYASCVNKIICEIDIGNQATGEFRRIEWFCHLPVPEWGEW